MVPPPPVILFGLLVWDGCHVVGTTCNDRRSLRNTFGWMGALQAPQQFHGIVLVEVQGARPLEAPKNLHCTVPKSESNILILPNNTWMVMQFFTCIAVQSHRKILKVQNFQLSSFLLEKKCVFSLFLAGYIKKASDLRVTDQCQDLPSKLQHLSDFSKNVLFFIIPGAQRHLGLCVNLS